MEIFHWLILIKLEETQKNIFKISKSEYWLEKWMYIRLKIL